MTLAIVKIDAFGSGDDPGTPFGECARVGKRMEVVGRIEGLPLRRAAFGDRVHRDILNPPPLDRRLHVEQQMLPLPGTDDLQEHLVLRLFHERKGRHETLAQNLDQRIALAKQPNRLIEIAR